MPTALTPFKLRIESLAIQGGLGQAAGGFELKPYHSRWKRLYSDEAYTIFDALRIEGLRLYHVGSTAVPGMSAQPVIDILGVVESLAVIDRSLNSLQKIGYELVKTPDLTDRRSFVLCDPASSRTFVHLEIFAYSDPQAESNRLIRNYLRNDLDAAEKFGQRKNQLSRESKSLPDYAEKKSALMRELMEKATAFGKQPRNILVIVGSAPGGKNTKEYFRECQKLWSLEISHGHGACKIIDLNVEMIQPFRYVPRRPAVSEVSVSDPLLLPEGLGTPVVQDAYFRIVKAMVAADLILLATPVYWYAMSGVMKDFMDRFSDLLGGPHKEFGELLCGKQLELISTGADESLPMGFEVPFSSTAIYFGMDYLGARYRSRG